MQCIYVAVVFSSFYICGYTCTTGDGNTSVRSSNDRLSARINGTPSEQNHLSSISPWNLRPHTPQQEGAHSHVIDTASNNSSNNPYNPRLSTPTPRRDSIPRERLHSPYLIYNPNHPSNPNNPNNPNNSGKITRSIPPRSEFKIRPQAGLENATHSTHREKRSSLAPSASAPQLLFQPAGRGRTGEQEKREGVVPRLGVEAMVVAQATAPPAVLASPSGQHSHRSLQSEPALSARTTPREQSNGVEQKRRISVRSIQKEREEKQANPMKVNEDLMQKKHLHRRGGTYHANKHKSYSDHWPLAADKPQSDFDSLLRQASRQGGGGSGSVRKGQGRAATGGSSSNSQGEERRSSYLHNPYRLRADQSQSSSSVKSQPRARDRSSRNSFSTSPSPAQHHEKKSQQHRASHPGVGPEIMITRHNTADQLLRERQVKARLQDESHEMAQHLAEGRQSLLKAMVTSLAEAS